MPRCNIQSHVVPSSRSPFEPGAAVHQCTTHQWVLSDHTLTTTTMCPIGRIEKATEEALAAIVAAKR